jgi:DNA-directed RNA polymerase specialized sigma24 family protein
MSARLDAWPESPEPAQLLRLQLRLLQTTRGLAAHIPSRDAEDVVQNAMIRYLREPPRPGSPTEEIRAHVALKRERANYYRARNRKPEQLTDQPAALQSIHTGLDSALIDAAVTIEQIAGPDARCVAELRGEGHALADAARILHWDTRRVEAARKQLERYKDRIALALNTQLKENHDDT